MLPHRDSQYTVDRCENWLLLREQPALEVPQRKSKGVFWNYLEVVRQRGEEYGGAGGRGEEG